MFPGLANAITSSILTRLLGNIFAFLVLVAALVVAVVELLRGEQINVYVVAILSTGIGYTMQMLALNQGVGLSPAKQPPKPAQTPGPGTSTQPLPGP